MSWINVTDSLPPVGKKVLFCGKGHTGREACYGELQKDGWHEPDGEEDCIWPLRVISHWRELPELPFQY